MANRPEINKRGSPSIRYKRVINLVFMTTAKCFRIRLTILFQVFPLYYNFQQKKWKGNYQKVIINSDRNGSLFKCYKSFVFSFFLFRFSLSVCQYVCYICGTHHKLPLFRFPKRRRQEWEQILMIPLHSRGKIYRFLCADHFLSSDVINGKHIVLRYFRHNYYWFHPPPSQAVIKLIQYKWISLCENDEQSQPWFII